MKKLFILICLSIGCLCLQAQDTKSEVEQKIPTDQVPTISQSWLKQAFSDIKGLKWYKEVTSGKTSFEAKFKHNGIRYSVEFDQEGVIEDVEKSLKASSLNKAQRQKLNRGFSTFEKFKLIKLQEQWTASNSAALLKAVRDNDATLAIIRYEVEFRAEIEGVNALWEGLFSKEGRLVSKRKIVLRPTDNLDY